MSQTNLAQFIITRGIPNRPRRSPLRPIRLDSDTELISPLSPDEQIIQHRGPLRSSPRRRTLQTSTPIHSLTSVDADLSMNLSTSSSRGSRTPTKNQPSAVEGVRKRLLMSGGSSAGGSTADDDSSFPAGLSPPATKKRKKLTKKADQSKAPCLHKRLSALSHEQLINVIEGMLSKHPELEKEVSSYMPAPDIKPLIENLEYFRRNTFKSFPNSRWGSGRDAFCFRRVKTHLDSFKNACISQGKQLLESESWEALIEYVLQGWAVIDEMPIWDNPSHNKSNEMCYRTLASQCKKAIKAASLDRKNWEDILQRIKETLETSEDLNPCIEMVEKKLQKC